MIPMVLAKKQKFGSIFHKDCKYISPDIYTRLYNEYNRIGAMLNSLMDNWETFEKE